MKKTITLLLLVFALYRANAQTPIVTGTDMPANPFNIISKPCAIIIRPTDKELAEMSKKNGTDNIETVNDNANVSIDIIKSYLDSARTPIIEKEAKGELKFKLLDGKIYALDHLDKLYWNVFLFNGENTPIKVTVQDFARQYINYMKIQK